MQVAAKIKLVDARAELGLSQTDLASLARVARQTVVNGERANKPIQRIQAYRILHALNAERQKVGKPALSITDIDWKIVGE